MKSRAGKHISAKEEAFIRDNWMTMHDGEIGSHIGRSAGSISYWRRTLGLKRKTLGTDNKEAACAAIRRHWGVLSVGEIANRVGLVASTVREYARELGYPPIEGTNRSSLVPSPPKGISREALIWARHNRDHPEARMILVMHADPAAGRRL